MMMWILRSLYGVLIVGVAVYITSIFAKEVEVWKPVLSLGSIVGIGVLVIVTDIMIRRKEITTISAVYVGLLLGLLLGKLFADALQTYLTEGVRTEFVQPIRLLIAIIFCYVATSLLLQTKDEFRFIIPYVEFSKQVKGNRPRSEERRVG